MKWFVLLHVLTAIIGLGPAFAFPFLLRRTESIEDMVRALHSVARLELFPKLFGTIAVLSGLLLLWIGTYGSWLQIWIVGTLFLYLIIEVLVVVFLNPTAKKLYDSLTSLDMKSLPELPHQAAAMYTRVRNLHLWASVLSLFIFALMILKPQ
ncbi:DUF2269 family protein [Paenibacillus piri]|uniref:DUF2269 family protein n=1 Tax=Paenibacillus piri TaxID=2547395 RepID=A0A4R5KN61_9BACL|nr:DUF2269 family protein [Paenibacillus piri]TDF97083.1 DUF2269 family protein [Paenibacillus piri]